MEFSRSFALRIGERVEAEIPAAVAPDRVDVVGLVLDIDRLDEQVGALDAIVVGFAGFERAGPAEV